MNMQYRQVKYSLRPNLLKQMFCVCISFAPQYSTCIDTATTQATTSTTNSTNSMEKRTPVTINISETTATCTFNSIMSLVRHNVATKATFQSYQVQARCQNGPVLRLCWQELDPWFKQSYTSVPYIFQEMPVKQENKLSKSDPNVALDILSGSKAIYPSSLKTQITFYFLQKNSCTG